MTKRQNKKRIDNIKQTQVRQIEWKAENPEVVIFREREHEAGKAGKLLKIAKSKSDLKRKNKTFKKKMFKQTGKLKYLIGLKEKTNRKLVTDYCKKIGNAAWGDKLINKLYPESINKVV